MMETLKKHRMKIIVTIVIAAILVAALAMDDFFGSRTINAVPDAPMTDVMGLEWDGETVILGQQVEEEAAVAAADGEELPDDYDVAEASETVEPVEVQHPETQHDTTHSVDSAHLAHPAARTPVEPENMARGDGSFYVTLSVRVDTLLHNMHLLHRDKHELVPENGVIFFSANVRAYEGESVFNVLQREMRRHGIHMSSRFTPVFNSAYVEAINNIYEFDGGPLSGWMYRVNGWFPNFGSSRYLLQPGDVIEWKYTVDLGCDIGGYFLGGWQMDE